MARKGVRVGTCRLQASASNVVIGYSYCREWEFGSSILLPRPASPAQPRRASPSTLEEGCTAGGCDGCGARRPCVDGPAAPLCPVLERASGGRVRWTGQWTQWTRRFEDKEKRNRFALSGRRLFHGREPRSANAEAWLAGTVRGTEDGGRKTRKLALNAVARYLHLVPTEVKEAIHTHRVWSNKVCPTSAGPHVSSVPDSDRVQHCAAQ